MGIRKRVRTKWKAERKEQIKKISAQRLKKAQKAAAKAATTATPNQRRRELSTAQSTMQTHNS